MGQIQTKWEQWVQGYLLILGFIFLLWFPLILLALPLSTVENQPVIIEATLQVDDFDPLYFQNTQAQSIVPISPEELQEFQSLYPEIFVKSGLRGTYQDIFLGSVRNPCSFLTVG